MPAPQDAGPAEPLQRRPPAYYQYELKGVVVHSGTAFAGHYYSYIKVRAECPSGHMQCRIQRAHCT